MRIKDQKSGVSLIIAIIFVSAFLLVIAGLAEAQLSTIRAIGNSENAGKTRYLAEMAVEFGVAWAAENGIGANMTDDSDLIAALAHAAVDVGIINCLDMNNDSIPGPNCIRIQVIGRPETETVQIAGASSPYFSIPMAGTGNAGENCTLANAPSDANDACNWNKLYVGQTVEIPLFYTNDSGVPQQLDDSGDFKLRIRAHGEEELFPLITDADNYRHIEKDPVLVQWTISGTSITLGGQVVGRTLVAMDRKEANYRLIENESEENTEISGGRINAAQVAGNDLNDFIVLQKDHQGQDITSGGSRDPRPISVFLSQVENPVLRLSLVSQPRRNNLAGGDPFAPDVDADINNTNFDLSYLEYQLLTDSSHPVADSKQIVVGWAEFGGFRKEVRREIQREPTLGGFVLEQF